MKVMIRRSPETGLSIYVPKKDLEEPIVESEHETLWGGWIKIANGWVLDLPEMAAGTSAVELTERAGHVLADEIGADRKLAVAAVHQDGELDRAGPAQVVQGVQGGADRAAGEEHVVDEDDRLPVHPVRGHLGPLQGASGTQPQVVAVHGDVKGAVRH